MLKTEPPSLVGLPVSSSHPPLFLRPDHRSLAQKNLHFHDRNPVNDTLTLGTDHFLRFQMPLLTADAEHVVAWLRTVRFVMD
jgi:hypothetical protein